jgi:hypothetical protein
LEVLFIWYCNFYLHLDLIKSKAEREARENGVGVTISGSTGIFSNVLFD